MSNAPRPGCGPSGSDVRQTSAVRIVRARASRDGTAAARRARQNAETDRRRDVFAPIDEKVRELVEPGDDGHDSKHDLPRPMSNPVTRRVLTRNAARARMRSHGYQLRSQREGKDPARRRARLPFVGSQGKGGG